MPKMGDEDDNNDNDNAGERAPEGTPSGDGGKSFENAKATVVRGPTFAAPESPIEDISRELVDALPRRKGEQVKCRRINGDHYRCNWWGRRETAGYDNPEMGGLLVTTHRVIRSQLVRARKTAAGLVIEPGGRQ
jgi:hypothetical protein